MSLGTAFHNNIPLKKGKNINSIIHDSSPAAAIAHVFL